MRPGGLPLVGRDRREPAPGETLHREDDRPYSPEGKTPERVKSHIDPEGDLHPANPSGTTSVQQHVRGGEPVKSRSPYTSFKMERNGGRVYGEHNITLDAGRLRKDIAAGRVRGVEIVEHDEVVRQLKGQIATAQAR
jgi:hypothetical protein